MATKRRYRTTFPRFTDDLYDYAQPRSTRKAAVRPEADLWQPVVTDDWPEQVPITAGELDVFEAHFTELLDQLFGPKD